MNPFAALQEADDLERVELRLPRLRNELRRLLKRVVIFPLGRTPSLGNPDDLIIVAYFHSGRFTEIDRAGVWSIPESHKGDF